MDIKYGKNIDIPRLKKGWLKDPKKPLRDIQKRISLLENPDNLVKVGHCYICKGRDTKPVLKIYSAEYVQCLDCSHVFLKARLSDEATQTFYREDSGYASTYVNRENCEYRKEHVMRPKIEFVQKYMSNEPGKARWLDVGSGSGESVSVLQDFGMDAVGLELSQVSRQFAKDQYGISLVPKTLQVYEEEAPEKFNVISFFGVLEHVTDPITVLQTSHRLLKPKGLVVAEVPNFDSFSTRVQSAFPKNVIRHAEPVGHMMLFTTPSLERAFGLTGFQAEALWYFGMDIHELIFNLCIQDETLNDKSIKHQLYDNLNYLQSIIDRSKLSDAILMVGIKA